MRLAIRAMLNLSEEKNRGTCGALQRIKKDRIAGAPPFRFSSVEIKKLAVVRDDGLFSSF